MKKTIKYILAMVIILPFLFGGCQKSETIEAEKFSETGFHKVSPIYCGEPIIANLVDWDQTVTPGIVTVGNDETTLYVTFEVETGWYFTKTTLYVGTADSVPGTLYPSDSGHFAPWLFPYIAYPEAGTQLYTFSIDLAELDDCFVVVANANVIQESTGDLFMVWGKSNQKFLGFYFEYCKQECEPPVYDCETAFAFGEDWATCFLDIPAIKNNRWGWTNGPLEEGTYSWPIYAGAGQCDISKGTWVGTLDVDYSGGTCNVTYNIDGDFTLEETHLFVGDDILPKKKNKYTTAPGQFPYSGESSYTIDVSNFDDVYIVAHSVVCGDYDE